MYTLAVCAIFENLFEKFNNSKEILSKFLTLKLY